MNIKKEFKKRLLPLFLACTLICTTFTNGLSKVFAATTPVMTKITVNYWDTTSAKTSLYTSDTYYALTGTQITISSEYFPDNLVLASADVNVNGTTVAGTITAGTQTVSLTTVSATATVDFNYKTAGYINVVHQIDGGITTGANNVYDVYERFKGVLGSTKVVGALSANAPTDIEQIYNGNLAPLVGSTVNATYTAQTDKMGWYKIVYKHGTTEKYGVYFVEEKPMLTSDPFGIITAQSLTEINTDNVFSYYVTDSIMNVITAPAVPGYTLDTTDPELLQNSGIPGMPINSKMDGGNGNNLNFLFTKNPAPDPNPITGNGAKINATFKDTTGKQMASPATFATCATGTNYAVSAADVSGYTITGATLDGAAINLTKLANGAAIEIPAIALNKTYAVNFTYTKNAVSNIAPVLDSLKDENTTITLKPGDLYKFDLSCHDVDDTSIWAYYTMNNGISTLLSRITGTLGTTPVSFSYGIVIPVKSGTYTYEVYLKDPHGAKSNTKTVKITVSKPTLTADTTISYPEGTVKTDNAFENDVHASTTVVNPIYHTDFSTAVDLTKASSTGYDATITVEDQYGNISDPVTVKVFVTLPAIPISLSADPDIYYAVGTTKTQSAFFTDVHATTTPSALTITSDFVSKVDLNTVANYTVTLNATDTKENIATSVKTIVHVVDAPVLSADPEVTYVINTAKAESNFLIDVNAKVTPVGLKITSDFATVVDLTKVGDYTVTLNAEDVNKISAIPVKTIVHIVAFTITADQTIGYNNGISKTDTQFLIDVNAKTNPAGTPITSDFATVVNLNKDGAYVVTLSATDEYGNVATTKTNVNIISEHSVYYNVTFDPQNKTLVTYEQVLENNTVSVPSKPAKSGSSFLNWTTDKAGNNAFDFNTPINEDITLYGQWTLVSAPVITDQDVTIEVHSKLTLAELLKNGNVIAKDSTGKDITSSIVATSYDKIDFDKLNDYVINLSATDSLKNTGKNTLIIHVVDTTPPVITATQTIAFNINQAVPFDKMLTAINAKIADNYWPNLTINQRDFSTVDFTKAGAYTFYLTGVDLSDNVATPLKITVNIVESDNGGGNVTPVNPVTPTTPVTPATPVVPTTNVTPVVPPTYNVLPANNTGLYEVFNGATPLGYVQVPPGKTIADVNIKDSLIPFGSMKKNPKTSDKTTNAIPIGILSIVVVGGILLLKRKHSVN